MDKQTIVNSYYVCYLATKGYPSLMDATIWETHKTILTESNQTHKTTYYKLQCMN